MLRLIRIPLVQVLSSVNARGPWKASHPQLQHGDKKPYLTELLQGLHQIIHMKHLAHTLFPSSKQTFNIIVDIIKDGGGKEHVEHRAP